LTGKEKRLSKLYILFLTMQSGIQFLSCFAGFFASDRFEFGEVFDYYNRTANP